MKQLQRALYETIDAITLMSEIKDPYTSGHQKKVAIISSAIATELGLSKDTIDGIYVAGLLHDVGKISVPNDILAKPGKLNEGEFLIIKNHPIVSYNILEHIEFPWPIANIVNQHHERMDGSGYPYGIQGEEMSVGSRILSVADVVEAMTAHRPYRPALGLKKALSEIGDNKGILYDREITEACIKVFKEKKVKF
jgi:putative nucleotidyltransferase with HDIG domain